MQNVTAPRIALVISNQSDGRLATSWSKAGAVRDDESLKDDLAEKFLNAINGANLNASNIRFDTISSLPTNYSCWQVPRVVAPGQKARYDICIIGHPTGKPFRSKVAFCDHFTWLQIYGLTQGCPCCLCTGKGGSGSVGIPMPTTLPPLQTTILPPTTAPATATITQAATTVPAAAPSSSTGNQALPIASPTTSHAPGMSHAALPVATVPRPPSLTQAPTMTAPAVAHAPHTTNAAMPAAGPPLLAQLPRAAAAPPPLGGLEYNNISHVRNRFQASRLAARAGGSNGEAEMDRDRGGPLTLHNATVSSDESERIRQMVEALVGTNHMTEKPMTDEELVRHMNSMTEEELRRYVGGGYEQGLSDDWQWQW